MSGESGSVTVAPLIRENFALVASWLANPATNHLLTGEWRDREVDTTVVALAVRNRKNLLYQVACEGSLCGMVAFSELEPGHRSGMIWYLLGDTQFRRRGITTSAVSQVCRIGFDTLGLASIWAMVLAPNEASIRLLKKIGFRPAGRLRNVERVADQQVDRLYFDLLPGELRGQNS